MGVKVYRGYQIDGNCYDKMFILQDSKNKDDFVVSFSGSDSSLPFVPVSERVTSEIEDMEDVVKISRIVDSYLCGVKINELTFPSVDRCYSEVLGSGRDLRLSITNPRLKCVYTRITDKYIQDRWDFCVNNESVNNIKIEFLENATYYEVGKVCFTDQEFIKFGLKGNKKVAKTERSFIIRYLYDRFNKIDEEVFVFPVYNSINSSDIDYYLFMCGDLRIYLSNDKRLLFLFDLVDEYNKEWNSIKEDTKKRQLKMEEF